MKRLVRVCNISATARGVIGSRRSNAFVGGALRIPLGRSGGSVVARTSISFQATLQVEGPEEFETGHRMPPTAQAGSQVPVPARLMEKTIGFCLTGRNWMV